jgi:glycerophosphoryl diester phosphodiesterase
MATDEATRAKTGPRRVGHKGAAHIVQGNTLASFDAALAHGVEMIEFDVLSERPDGSGCLFVAHDYQDMRSRTPLRLEQALEHLAGEAFAGIEFDLDVKLPGYELRVVNALRDAGLTGRTLLSGMFPASLACVRGLVGTAGQTRLYEPHAHRDPCARDAHRLPCADATPRA